ncbi:MAG: PQQ-dependent dehydrogenase, methanol/ethanol family [Pseudomonadales bacterium]
MKKPLLLASSFVLLILQAGCDQQNTDSPAPADTLSPGHTLNKEASVDGNWLTHGRDDAEQRFSPLTQIDSRSVERIGLAWQQDMSSTRGLEATPIVIDGVMYTTSTWSRVVALDAKTGEILWQYDPKVPRSWARRLCCDVVNRGVAVSEGKVLFGTLDGRLLALNAKDGNLLWETDTLIDRDQWYSITGAPRVVKGKVIIGNGGAEFSVRGYVSAYDLRDGKLQWRFFTVPASADGPFEHEELSWAAKTWSKESNWTGAGGTAWDSMAYDAELDLLYVGTGNGSPWPRDKRSPGGGDNLFLASILALKPDSGELVWHYQTTPRDTWDFTATQHMILADIKIDEQERQVIMQAPKNGFFYVLDRLTGELLSAEKYVFVNWASHVDLSTGRPIETGLGDYLSEDKYVFPSAAGGHNWQPMSFSPDTGLVYFTARDIGWVHSMAEDKWFTYGANDLKTLTGTQQVPLTSGYLKAWNPATQTLAWQKNIANIWNGGVLSTAGKLVVYGTAMGDLVILEASSGQELKRISTGTGIIAPPISYSVDGEQYLAVMAGWGGPAFNTLQGNEALLKYENQGRLLSFKLGGGQVEMPHPVPPRGPFPEPPSIEASAATIEHGRKLFVLHCGGCHGVYDSIPMLPDLRRMTPAVHALFDDIVLEGIFEAKGMASFADALSKQDSFAIRAHIIELAKQARSEQSRTQ